MKNTILAKIFRGVKFTTLFLVPPLFFAGCTLTINSTIQPSTALPNENITVEVGITSEQTAATNLYGYTAVLLPTDWTVASTSFYRSNDPGTIYEMVASTTLIAPNAGDAPVGYYWYVAQTENRMSFPGTQYVTGTINMVVGSATGTFSNLEYWVGDEDDGWMASSTGSIIVSSEPDPNADEEIVTYSLSYAAGLGGSITGSMSQTVASAGSGTAVTAVANAGYRFVRWNDSVTANPRTDTNVTGDINVSAIFETTGGGGGGGAPIVPSGVGNGASDKTLKMNEIGDIGTISATGINYLTYINSEANFDTKVSRDNSIKKFRLHITHLDLALNTINFTIQPLVTEFGMKLGETVQIDLDNDGIKDIEIKFANIWVNRVELTIKSLFGYADVKTETKTETTIIAKYFFKRNLSLGMTGADVKELQKYLNANGYIVSKSGAGSVGKETVNFGPATRASLVKFQKANKIKPAVGYFGPVTRKIVNAK